MEYKRQLSFNTAEISIANDLAELYGLTIEQEIFELTHALTFYPKGTSREDFVNIDYQQKALYAITYTPFKNKCFNVVIIIWHKFMDESLFNDNDEYGYEMIPIKNLSTFNEALEFLKTKIEQSKIYKNGL